MSVYFTVSGPASGQDASVVTSVVQPDFVSTWIPDIGPLTDSGSPLEAPVADGTVAQTENYPGVEIYTDNSQQIPILRRYGDYYDPSGTMSPGPISALTNQQIHANLQKAHDMGFRTYVLRLDWPGLEPQADKVETARVQEIMEFASDLEMGVLISLEFKRAPQWFFQGQNGSDRVCLSFLVDPERETIMGNDGALRWNDGTGVPIMYHPDTVRSIEEIIYTLYYSLKDNNALLGWLVDGPVTFAYPGGGRNGILGISDYSPYTVNRFYQATGINRMPYPKPRYSTNSWDDDPNYRAFYNMRLSWKRSVFDMTISALREVDDSHLILIGMEPALNYRDDNGYLSHVMIPDSSWQLSQSNVNGAAIGFRLSSRSFEAINNTSRTSAAHLLLTISQVLRKGKIPLVIIEPDNNYPPTINEIDQIAQMIKAAGAYPVWTNNYYQKNGTPWSWIEWNAIERTNPLSLLPPPRQLRRGDIALLDLPQFYSTFYSSIDGELVDSLVQIGMHQRAGVLLEIVGESDLLNAQKIKDDYKKLILLDNSPLQNNEDAIAWLSPYAQIGLSILRDDRNILDRLEPMLISQYKLEDYRSPKLEDWLRVKYVNQGAMADFLHGGDAVIVANLPYVFIRINNLGPDRYIDVKLDGWPESNLSFINMIDVTNDNSTELQVRGTTVSYQFGPKRNISHMYILSDDFAPISRFYDERVKTVAVHQQSQNMRRSMPAALLLGVLLGVTLMWMSFQTQQSSLLQAAELVEKRRRIEPIDILEDQEVMEFYKKYISTDDDRGDGAETVPDNSDHEIDE
jgi:hypothetical protein